MGVKPEGKFKDELMEELIAKERAISKAREKLKGDTRVARGKIDALEERRDEVLDLLEGNAGEQAALPLTTGKNGKKVAPPPLIWEKEGANEVAHIPGLGTYCIELGTGGKYDVLHTPPGGRSKVVGSAPTGFDAREVAKRHMLAEGADAILANAGDGKLTRKGRAALKGVDRA